MSGYVYERGRTLLVGLGFITPLDERGEPVISERVSLGEVQLVVEDLGPDPELARFGEEAVRRIGVALGVPPELLGGPGCCDLHGRRCEPGELCCDDCTEAAHPAHSDGSVCSSPDLTAVAAGGWCAPSEVVYDIASVLETTVTGEPVEHPPPREPTQAEMVASIAETVDRADAAIADWDSWKDAAVWVPGMEGDGTWED